MGKDAVQQLQGWSSLNGYYDTMREAPVGTVTLSLTPTSPLSYFGFTDFSKKDYWMENNMRLRIGGSPFSASLQHVGASGLPAHLLRAGALVNFHEVSWLKNRLAAAGIFAFGVDFHLFETTFDMDSSRGLDNLRKGGQIEPFIAGAIPGTDGRFFYEGWLDLDVDYQNRSLQTTAVSDFLIGYTITGNPVTTGTLAVVVEGRYNEHFERLRNTVPVLRNEPSLHPTGAEIGLRYFAAF